MATGRHTLPVLLPPTAGASPATALTASPNIGKMPPSGAL